MNGTGPRAPPVDGRRKTNHTHIQSPNNERRKTTVTGYLTPGGTPPQLTIEEVRAMSHQDVTKADDLGQLAAIKQGRRPTDAERRGERAATPAEIIEGVREQREREKQAGRAARADVIAQARRDGIDL